MNSDNKYKILIIEPSEIVSTGITNIINRSKNFAVKEIYKDLSLYHKNKSINYDIIIINPSVIDYSNRFDVKSILSNDNQINVISLYYTISYDESLLKQFDNNITIYDSYDQIIKKLNTVINTKEEITSTSKNELSVREKEILIAIARGKANKEIAEELNLSVFTVITHRKNISHKLGINSISGLTVYAIMNNLIDVNDF